MLENKASSHLPFPLFVFDANNVSSTQKYKKGYTWDNKFDGSSYHLYLNITAVKHNICKTIIIYYTVTKNYPLYIFGAA